MNAILEAPILTDNGNVGHNDEAFCDSDATDVDHEREVAGSTAAESLPNGAGQLPEPEMPRSTPTPLLEEEFDALYQTHKRRVYQQCCRMLGNPDDAEDLTQEVFLQLYRKAGTFRGESSFSTWLHRLTVNTVLMQMRRYRRWRGMVTSFDAPPCNEDGAVELPAAVGALPARTSNPTDKLSLDTAIGQLSSGYREIFLLHDQEGYRHDEIAKLLGISEGTSKSQLHKARHRLRGLVG